MNRREFHIRAGALAAVALTTGTTHLIASDHISGSLWCYPWDLSDEGYDTVFDHIRENGMQSMSLACAYHTGKFLVPHNPRRKVVFVEDGKVYFKPSPARYGRIKPLVSALVGEGHTLAAMKHRAEKAGLATNAWVVCCHNTALGMQYPASVCVDAFGDPIVHNLCPSNNDVRAYLRALVADIAGHGVHRIELEALQFQGYAHGFHHEREGILLSGGTRFLLGLCFCPSCDARARHEGVEIESVRRFTRDTLSKLFEETEDVNGRYRSPEDLPADLFKPFHAWRQRVVSSLAAELMEAVAGSQVRLRPLASIDASARITVGMNAAKTAGITGGILVPGYVKDGAALSAPLQEILTEIGSNELILGQQVGLPESGGKTEFLDRMQTARAAGVRSFNFYNYGFVPKAKLKWIREAIKS